MTDRRVKDLSYGRLGKPVYETESGWIFAQDVNLEQSFKQIAPFRDHVKSSLPSEPRRHKQISIHSRKKSLVKRFPELQAATDLPTDLSRTTSAVDGAACSSLLSYGQGLDPERVTGRSSTFPILAIPSGEAGHLLRVIRPRIERRSWNKESSESILVLLSEASDEAIYEIGSKSTIRQLLFSDGGEHPGTFLAVRQSTEITVLRISYITNANTNNISNGVSIVKPTNLVPSSVVTIPPTENDTVYADVTFNPLYHRQLGVVDQAGNWKIWDYEPPHGRGRSPRITPGRSGNVLDSYVPDTSLQIPEYSFDDGFNRICWVCNLSTILVCNRTHLAVFDVQSDPIRLDSTDFMISKNIEIILDVKRSAKSISDVFVLTSSRIYWLKIVPSSMGNDDPDGRTGVHVVFSYRHFRNENDLDMRLTTLDDQFVSVLVHSTSTSVVNFFGFTDSTDGGHRQSSQGSFMISEDNSSNIKISEKLSAMVWVPCPLETLSRARHAGEETSLHAVARARFLQALFLNDDLRLVSALYAVVPGSHSSVQITAPIWRASKRRYNKGKRSVIQQDFIVQDVESETEDHQSSWLERRTNQDPNALLLDWTHIFETAISGPDAKSPLPDPSSATLTELTNRLKDGLTNDNLIMGTLWELLGIQMPAENLDQLGQLLDQFLETLPVAIESPSELVVENLHRFLGNNLSLAGSLISSDMMKIYQDSVDSWIVTLPPNAPMALRGAKFRMVKNLIVELCLSMVTLSLRNRASKVPTLATSGNAQDDEAPITRESSPATFYSAQASFNPSHKPELNLPTPVYTPSAYSQETSTSGLMEDPAITRLRQYALSIRSKPDSGKSKILSEWPIIPGVDPSTYIYKDRTADSEAEDSEQDSRVARKEAMRRRKRTERFVQRGTAQSSRAVTPAGSQPSEAPGLPFSSQPTLDVPMTQPDRGVFGSRKGKGKKKQRTAGF